MVTGPYPHLNDEWLRKIQTVQGARPVAAPVPPPGVYWLRSTSCNFYWVDKDGTRLEHPSHNLVWAVYTWELSEVSEWFLAKVDKRGDFEIMSSDEVGQWEHRTCVVTHVGPRVDPPEE